MKNAKALILLLLLSGVLFGQNVGLSRGEILPIYEYGYSIKKDSTKHKVCYESSISGDFFNSGVVNCFYFNKHDVCDKWTVVSKVDLGELLNDTSYFKKHKDGYIVKEWDLFLRINNSGDITNEFVYTKIPK